MYFDNHFQRPSDNPLRVALYAISFVLIAYTLVIAAHAVMAGDRTATQESFDRSIGKADTAATSASRGLWGGWWRDATSMGVGTDQSGSPNRDTCGCTNNAGRMSGPV